MGPASVVDAADVIEAAAAADALDSAEVVALSASRRPPPAAVELGSEPLWRAGSALVSALSAAAAAVWLCQRWMAADTPDLWGWILLSGLPALLAGWWGWRMATVPASRLTWDGREWRLRPRMSRPGRTAASAEYPLPSGCVCSPQVMIDLGGWMLLRLDNPSSAFGDKAVPRWVAVSEHLAGASWHGLRVALHGAPHGAPTGLPTQEPEPTLSPETPAQTVKAP